MTSIREILSNIVYYGLESLGKYYSSYRGYVVDNNDEDGLGKIKVKIPSVLNNKEHPTWAYPKTQMGGNDYGIQMLPLIGDIIWVEFEHGDTRFPYWSFAHRAANEKPIEFISPQIYGFKSPKGQLVIIDDRDGSEKIIVKSTGDLVMDSVNTILSADEIFFNGEIRGTPRFAVGANGVFASTDGKIVQVTNGLITGIT